MLEAAEKRISETVEAMRANIESSLEANNSRVSECEAKISGIEEKVVQHASTVNKLVAEQDLRIQELQHQMSRLQNTSSPLNCTTYVYKTLDDVNSQLKFFGRENENPMNFIKVCQRDLEAIGDNLSEADKINFVVRRLKGTAAEWFSVAQDKISTYEDLVKHFRARYWNERRSRGRSVCNWSLGNIPVPKNHT